MLNIYFTDDEMQKFLTKKGYHIEEIDTYRSENVYHNRVEYYDTKSIIAYKTRPKLKDNEQRRVESDYGIEKVFSEELKKAILEL